MLNQKKVPNDDEFTHFFLPANKTVVTIISHTQSQSLSLLNGITLNLYDLNRIHFVVRLCEPILAWSSNLCAPATQYVSRAKPHKMNAFTQNPFPEARIIFFSSSFNYNFETEVAELLHWLSFYSNMTIKMKHIELHRKSIC